MPIQDHTLLELIKKNLEKYKYCQVSDCYFSLISAEEIAQKNNLNVKYLEAQFYTDFGKCGAYQFSNKQ